VMRRKELELTDPEQIRAVLDSCMTLRLGMIADGMPYIIPMAFGYIWTGELPVFYLHCGMAGRKNSALYDGARLCFELDIEGALTGRTDYANGYSREFACVMGEGTIAFAKNNEEKIAGFRHIMRHQTGRENYSYQEGWLSLTRVFTLRAVSLSAARKGMRTEEDKGSRLPEQPDMKDPRLITMSAEDGFSF